MVGAHAAPRAVACWLLFHAAVGSSVSYPSLLLCLPTRFAASAGQLLDTTERHRYPIRMINGFE
jgi:hypothetical protein